MSFVAATYIGPEGYALDTGTILVPGETVVDMPEFQAEEDPHWDTGSAPATTPQLSPPSGALPPAPDSTPEEGDD